MPELVFMRCLDAFADAVERLTEHITPEMLAGYVERSGWVRVGLALNGHAEKWSLVGADGAPRPESVVIPLPSYTVYKDGMVKLRQAVNDVLEAEGWPLLVQVVLQVPEGLRSE